MSGIDDLRKEMKTEGIDIYIVPTSDPHQSEYVSDHWKAREYFSGFTGSAGTLIVTEDRAILWTDGRYFIQAEKELEGSGVELFKIGIKGYPTVSEFIREELKAGKKIGIFGELISINSFEAWIKGIDGANYELNIDLADRVWSERPRLEHSELFVLDKRYSGESAADKLSRLREHMEEKNEHIHIVSSLDEIAYLYNLRGRDIKNNPVFLSYSIISRNKAVLFTDSEINGYVREYAEEQGFEIRPMEEFGIELESIKFKNIGLDPLKVNMWIKEKLQFNKFIYGNEILTEFEAVRNSVQIENMKELHKKDGAAVIKMLKYVRDNIESGVTEIDISNKLIEFRSEIDGFIEPSFDTIAAYKDHGAMMHYCADEESNYTLKPEGLLLIDSGGQYLLGTTDITRTVSLGKPSEAEIRDYTLALKGLINLSRTRFLERTSGAFLDITAREFLWREGIDYKCGTGHGVGYLLSVHLGNQRISPAAKNSFFKPGMVVTNEPGVYRAGEYGIRIENMLLVRKSDISSEDDFLEFETLTLCPFDRTLIDFELLSEEEIEFIRAYHKRIRKELSEYLSSDEMELVWEI